MDERNPFPPPPLVPVERAAEQDAPLDAPADAPAGPQPLSPAVQKFKSCRWRSDPEAGEFCAHRDVLPFAGKEGFVPDSWCPDCAFYKLRRTPKKRDYSQY